MNKLLLIAALVSATGVSQAQKAYPIELGSLLQQMPVPRISSACYEVCKKETDGRTGLITVMNDGPTFEALKEKLNKVLQASVAGMQPPPPNPSAATASAPGQKDMESIKYISQVQGACIRISQVSGELNAKIMELDKNPIENVRPGPECHLTGSESANCGCKIPHATDYETRRVAARDAYLQKAAALFDEYISRLRPLVAEVDAAMVKTNYGEAISNPRYRQQVVTIQRQALAPLTSVLGAASALWDDAAKQYAGLVNAKSGATTGCYTHK